MKNALYAILLVLVALLLNATGASAQSTVSAEDIVQKINRKQSVSLSNATIRGTLDLTELSNKKVKKNRGGNEEYKSTVEVPLTFRNCRFRGDVIAYKVLDQDGKEQSLLGNILSNGNTQVLYTADFAEAVVFENCTFEGLSEFKYSHFAERVSFAGSTFHKSANFKYADFKASAAFANTNYTNTANFKYAHFRDLADFSDNRIDDYADFKYAHFTDGVSFNQTTFRGFADFKYAEFRREGNFSDVSFRSGNDFKYAKGSRYVSSRR